MAQGSFWVWMALWSPWAVLVVLDVIREPRDWRWLIAALGLGTLAALTWGRLRGMEGRYIVAIEFASAFLMMALFGGWSTRRRRRDLVAWSGAHGFEPLAVSSKRAERSLPDPLRRLPILSRTAWPRTRNLMIRTEPGGRETWVFDLTTPARPGGLGFGRGPIASTMVAVRTPGGKLPLFQVRPRDLHRDFDGGPIAESVAMPHAPGFARAYRLGGHEPRNLAAQFDADLAGAIATRPGWIMAGEGEWSVAAVFDDARGLRQPRLREVSTGGLADHVGEASNLLGRIADRAGLRGYRAAEVA